MLLAIKRLRGLAAAASLGMIASAHAYVIESSAWRMGTTAVPTIVPMQLELQTGGPANRILLDGSTSWNQVAAAALNDWNQYLVTMQYKGVMDSVAGVSATEASNGVNTVTWSPTIYGEAWGSAVGITIRYYQISGTIYPTTEADVLFDSAYSWDSYRGAVRSVGDLRRVAIHEFGHALGLDHPDDYGQSVAAIMNRSVSNTDDLTADDINGGEFLYNAAPPTITAQPASRAVSPGSAATFTVGTASGAVAFQWLFNGTAITGATGPSYRLTNAQSVNQGNYQVIVSDRAGQVTSGIASLTVASGAVLTTSPSSQTVSTGAAVTLSVAATGSNLTYQWTFNGAPIAGATSASYSIPVAGATDAGTYAVVVSNGTVATTSASAILTVNTTARLINLSTHANAGIGANVLAAGFVVGGSGTKNILVRGVGPTLSAFGLTGVLPDPQLTLVSGSTIIGPVGPWGGSPTLSAAFTAVSAFPFSSPNSADSALLAILGPIVTPQSTSAQVGSLSSNQGIAMVEVYDADNNPSSPARLTNLSVRAVSSAGSGMLTAGFVVQGTSSLTVLIRGDGPSLGGFGVTGYLTNPVLTVYRQSDQAVVASSTGWANNPALAAVFAQVFAFPFTAGSADSAVLVTLPPGLYSASVVNADGSSGVGLIELYEVR